MAVIKTETLGKFFFEDKLAVGSGRLLGEWLLEALIVKFLVLISNLAITPLKFEEKKLSKGKTKNMPLKNEFSFIIFIREPDLKFQNLDLR